MIKKIKRSWHDYKWFIIPLLIIMSLLISQFIWDVPKCVIYLGSAGLPISFIIWFLIAGKRISQVDISVEKLTDYVGERSNFHTLCHGNPNSNDCSGNNKNRKECGKEEIKNGLEKNLRIFYSRWFGVFVIMAIIAIIMTFQYWFHPIDNHSLLEMTPERCSITVKVKENKDYKIEKKSLVTSKDTLKFPVMMEIKSSDNNYPWIKSSYVIDTIIVTFDSAVKLDSVKELPIQSKKYSIPIICKIKREENSDLKDIKYRIDAIERHESIVKKDTNDIINSIVLWCPDNIDRTKREQFFHQDTMQEEWFKKVEDTIKPSLITNLLITNFIKDAIKELKKELCKEDSITPNTDQCPPGDTYKKKLDALRSIIGLSKEEKNKSLNRFYNEFDKSLKKLEKRKQALLTTTLNAELDNIITGLNEVQKEKKSKQTLLEELEKILKDHEIKPPTIKNFYFTSTAILSLLVNVLLLLIFGFLNTKTDLFAKEKNSDDYVVYKNFVIGTFIVICLILLVNFFVSAIDFSDSLMFVMYLLIAVTSIIAIFGCWGSMNNSYSKFPDWFTFSIIFYAMTNFFELYLPYVSANSFSELIETFLFFVSCVGKWLIIWILLSWAPNNKRILWYFFTTTNNFRTENDYDDFKKIFSIKPNLFNETWQKRKQIAKTLRRKKTRNLK